MIAQQIGAGIGGERREPEPRAHPGRLDPVRKGLHVGVAARKFGAIEFPVAFRRLPSVVEHRPFEADVPGLGQRGEDFVDGELPAIAPGAPDRRIARLGDRRGGDAARRHDPAIGVERAEMIALMRHHEKRRQRQGRAGREERGLVAGDADPRPARLPRDRERDEARDDIDMADREPDVAPPHRGDGGAAAVIRGVHAHEVALAEPRGDRLHPIAAIGIRGAREAPRAVGMREQIVRCGVPAGDCERRRAGIAIGDVEQGEPGIRIEEGDRDALLDIAPGGAAEMMDLAAAVRAGNRLAALIDQQEAIDDALIIEPDRLARLHRGERGRAAREARMKRRVELDRQHPVRQAEDRRVAGRDAGGGAQRRGDREHRARAHQPGDRRTAGHHGLRHKRLSPKAWRCRSRSIVGLSETCTVAWGCAI